jgi:hypothetical protein
MTTAQASSLHTPRRQRVLRALGVTPWALRAAATSNAQTGAPVMAPALAEAQAAHCVVLLPAGCATRELDLLGRALCAFGPGLARAARIEVSDGRAASMPAARAYLAFGEAQAHALGRELSAERQREAHIVLADTPQRVLADAQGKRRLWHALRQLRRALLAADDAPASG